MKRKKPDDVIVISLGTILLYVIGILVIFGLVCIQLFSNALIHRNSDQENTQNQINPPLVKQVIQVKPLSSITPISGDAFQRKYEWTFKGKNWVWEAIFSKELYDYYYNKSRPQTSGDYSVYVSEPHDDVLIDDIVEILTEAAKTEKYDKLETANFVASFVQSLKYIPDDVSTPYDEYPRYPIETLVEDGGDCEDTAILAASLLDRMDYDVRLISLPEHMAVGIAFDNNISGRYYESDNKKYYYLETTAEYSIGEMPIEFQNIKAELLLLIPRPIIRISVISAPQRFESNGHQVVYAFGVKIKNQGTETAKNFTVWIGFETTSEGVYYDQIRSDRINLQSGSDMYYTAKLSVPGGVDTRWHVMVSGENFIYQEAMSNWVHIEKPVTVLKCQDGYVLGNDELCHRSCGGPSTYCSEGSYCYNGQCVSCSSGYYLGIDGRCYRQ